MAAAALLAWTGCSTVKQTVLDVPGMGRVIGPGAEYEISVGDPFPIAMSDGPMLHGDYSFPMIRRFGDELMVAWSTQGDVTGGSWISVDGEGRKFTEAPIRSPTITTNGGLTWEIRAPRSLALQVTNVAAAPAYRWHAQPQVVQPLFGMARLRSGDVVGYQHVVMAAAWPDRRPPDRQDFNAVGMGMRWINGTAQPPHDVWFNIPDLDVTKKADVMYISPVAHELDDGRIILVCYSKVIYPYKTEGRYGHAQGYVTMLFVSADGGVTFQRYAPVASTRHATYASDGPSEPGFVALANGEWLCVMRTGSFGTGHGVMEGQIMLQSRSKDQGLTWKHRSTGRRGVWPVLLQMQNGVVACVYGRPGNRIAFSADQGETWFRTVTLTPDLVASSSYNDVMEIEPGRLLVVYDQRGYAPPGQKLWDETQGRNVVLGRHIDVKKAGP